MQKLEQERDIHTDFYIKEGNVFVSITRLHDYAHDICVEAEIDMKRLIVTGAKFTFDRYPEKKCELVKDMEKRLIGMSVGNGAGEEIMKRFAGRDGCENVMSLLFLGVSGIVFIDYINRMKEGVITPADFMKDISAIRNNACIAFNPAAHYEEE